MQLFIDKGYTAVAFRDQRSTTGDFKKEREANAFAAAILMPACLIKNAIEELEFDLADEDALTELAGSFEVSSLAMSFRLINLGYLSVS